MRGWRIGHVSAPLDFVPRNHCTWLHRFDDPLHEYRTLYCAEERLTCFYEVFQDREPDTQLQHEFANWRRAPAGIILAGEVTWKRREELALASGVSYVHGGLIDLDDLSVRRAIEKEHAELLGNHGLAHLNIAEIRSRQREITQAVSRSLYEQGAAGVRYSSNLDNRRCFALFEGRGYLEADGEPERLTENLPELIEVCDHFSLVLRTR